MVRVVYRGGSPRTDAVLGLRWVAGEARDLTEDEWDAVRKFGWLVADEGESDDGDSEPPAQPGCPSKGLHYLYSRENTPCPDCGEDKWVVTTNQEEEPLAEDDGEEE